MAFAYWEQFLRCFTKRYYYDFLRAERAQQLLKSYNNTKPSVSPNLWVEISILINKLSCQFSKWSFKNYAILSHSLPQPSAHLSTLLPSNNLTRPLPLFHDSYGHEAQSAVVVIGIHQTLPSKARTLPLLAGVTVITLLFVPPFTLKRSKGLF